MGKRSDFERIDKDFYRTIDPRAVEALIPFLPDDPSFAEPCYGDGDLVKSLEAAGMSCGWLSDLSTGQDALRLTSEVIGPVGTIITNPPWSRPILHQMIRHFAYLRPTWLLFDADWMHTRQSAELMGSLCTDVVSVGRLIWMPGTKTSGKDNCCWYRFDDAKRQETRFHGRR